MLDHHTHFEAVKIVKDLLYPRLYHFTTQSITHGHSADWTANQLFLIFYASDKQKDTVRSTKYTTNQITIIGRRHHDHSWVMTHQSSLSSLHIILFNMAVSLMVHFLLAVSFVTLSKGFYLPGLAPTNFCPKKDKDRDSSLNCGVSYQWIIILVFCWWCFAIFHI